MPSGSSSRKRKRNSSTSQEKPVTCAEHQDGLSLAERSKHESLASKIKKRMLEESVQSHPDGKCYMSTGGQQLSGMDDSSRNMFCNFEARACVPLVPSTQIFERLQQSRSLTHYLYTASLGVDSAVNRKSVLNPVVRELHDLHLFRTASPFNRRVTALEWHPSQPNMVVAGSKGGDLIFWNTLQHNLNDHFIQGIGPGGSIKALKIWPWNGDRVLTASEDGKVMLRDWEQKHCQILSDTFNSYDFWYCCVDVSAARKAVVTGDNVGNTVLLSSDGKKVWTHRLHKQKVSHVEFSPRDDWLLCTASNDTTVKVWDLRNIAGRHSALYELKHDRPINSAYFSRTDGCRLLTTDQYSQIRVYRAPSWHLERTVEHPHRFFRHLTPIKAAWHPLQDLVVVGRYPSKDFPGYTENELRTIDIIDADTGKMLCQLHDPAAPGIVSLNKFNDRGDYLFSSMGVNLLLWGRSQDVEERRNFLVTKFQYGDVGWLEPMNRGRPGSGTGLTSRKRRPPPSKQSKAKDTEVKVKVGTKTRTKTQKR